MSTRQKKLKVEPDSLPGSRGGQRRNLILTAFHDCVIQKGYAKTTLRDIASAADMTASHLLYYFSGKDAILEHYFNKAARRIMDRINSFRDEKPNLQIDLLSELFLTNKGISNTETGFMLECFGVAVHERQLRSAKTALDRFCKDYLQELFLMAVKRKGEARAHAEVAYAMLIGLRTAAFFDQRLELSEARRLFQSAVLFGVKFEPT